MGLIQEYQTRIFKATYQNPLNPTKLDHSFGLCCLFSSSLFSRCQLITIRKAILKRLLRTINVFTLLNKIKTIVQSFLYMVPLSPVGGVAGKFTIEGFTLLLPIDSCPNLLHSFASRSISSSQRDVNVFASTKAPTSMTDDRLKLKQSIILLRKLKAKRFCQEKTCLGRVEKRAAFINAKKQ